MDSSPYHLHYQHKIILVECNAVENVPSAHPQHETSQTFCHGFTNQQLQVLQQITAPAISSSCSPTHCPAAHCSAMTHHFNLNLLYLEAPNYGAYQAKDQTWVTINYILCTNTLQSNLKTSTDVIRNLHNTPLINSLNSIFPTINSVPDIFIIPCIYIYIYIYI